MLLKTKYKTKKKKVKENTTMLYVGKEQKSQGKFIGTKISKPHQT